MPQTWPTTLQRYKHIATDRGLALISNISSIEGTEEQFGSDFVLRRATEDEAKDFSPLVKASANELTHERNPWESKVATQTPGDIEQGRFVVEPLAISDHRYHVADFAGNGFELHDVLDASVMSSGPALVSDLGLYFGPSEGFASSGQLTTFRDETAISDVDLPVLTRRDADDIRNVLPKLKTFAPNSELRRALSDFNALRRISRTSKLRMLGLFIILESLVAHKPQRGDRTDAISRQVARKMTLHQQRFERPWDHKIVVNPSAPSDTFWMRMYDLRSAIAHRETPNAKDDGLELLKSMSTARDLLVGATRSLLRRSLEDPALVFDVREC